MRDYSDVINQTAQSLDKSIEEGHGLRGNGAATYEARLRATNKQQTGFFGGVSKAMKGLKKNALNFVNKIDNSMTYS